MYLANVKAALLAVVLHVVILQPALAGLIADRTVDRVIDQQKLQDGFPRGQDFGTLRQDRHALGHLRIAGDLQLGHLLDLDEAHAAISRDGKLRVIAVVRDRHSHLRRHLDDGLAFGGNDFFTVEVDFYWIHN
jgi:hypothetical protein